MRAEVETLDCGVEAVFLQHRKSVQGTSARLVFNSGALHEQEPDIPGTAHFLEHVALFTGTESYPTSKQLFAAADTHDTSFNAFTDWTSTWIEMEGTKAAFVIALCLEMGFMPTLTEQGVEQDRTAISEEARAGLHNPRAAVEDSVRMLFAGNHPSRSTSGTLENVAEITHDGVIRFHKEHWMKSNARLYVVSDQPVDRIRRTTNSILRDFPDDEDTRREPRNLNLPWLDTEQGVNIEHSFQPEQQAEVDIAFPLVTPKSFEDCVLDEAATDFIRSAFWRQIRIGRNVTYHAVVEDFAFSNTSHGAKEQYNSLFISTAIRPNEVSSIFDALNRLADEIPKIRGLGGNILREYGYYLAGKELYSRSEAADDMIESDQLSYCKIYDPSEEAKIVKQLRVRDVLARAQEIIQGIRITHIAGPTVPGVSGTSNIAAAMR